MSFAQSLAGPAMNVLRMPNLQTAAKTVGVVVAGGLMATVYNLTHDETKTAIHNWRARRRFKSARHEVLLSQLMGSALHPALQEHLLNAHDAFRACIAMMANPHVKDEDKAVIRSVFDRVLVTDNAS